SELVIQGAARVARLPRHLFEHEVAVAVAGEAPRGRLEQRAPRAGAALSLGRTPADRRRRCRRVAHHQLDTYMRVCMVPSRPAMNVPLIVAGSFAIIAAAIHGA